MELQWHGINLTPMPREVHSYPFCQSDPSRHFEYTLNYLIDNELDLSIFNERYQNDDTGAPAYDPKILLKIILFAYSRGVVSSRKIERACRENVIFMALSTDSRPHFTTIADFISSKVNIQWNLFCIIHNMKKGHAYGMGFV